jgi:transposase
MKERKKPYSAEFRVQMLELIKAGLKPKQLAVQFGCHVMTLRDWMKQGG